jgi:small subunit ribosomal protein S1
MGEDASMPTTEDFAAMLGEAPVSMRSFQVGDRVKAPVVKITPQAVFVDLGGKSEGFLDVASVLDREGQVSVRVGDTLEGWVLSVRGGTVKLGPSLSAQDGGDDVLGAAAAEGLPVEGKVTGTNKGGFTVEIFGRQAFCPLSQIDFQVGEPESWVGQTLRFKVTRSEEGGRNVVVSRQALLREERDMAARQTLEQLAPGASLQGVVTRVMPFGAFVDLGGVEGLVHVSELSYQRVQDATEAVQPGQSVTVQVLRIDEDVDPRKRRIALSMKALAQDPMLAAMERLQVGSMLVATITRLERFGAFAELEPGVEGLIHISELSLIKRIQHPSEVLEPGQRVEVQVLGLDPLKRQIALSMKSLQDDPWQGVEGRFAVGSTVQATVEGVTDRGLRLTLADGMGAFLPLSQLAEGESKSVHTRFRPGTGLEARVLEVDRARRRITLSRRPDDEAGRRDFESWQRAQSGSSMGTLGDLLRQARPSRS